MRPSVAIQHHPERAHLLPPLLEALDGLDVQIVTDPEPAARIRSPWRTYRRALAETPEWATHRLIVQDDVQPCPDFAAALTASLEARPDRVIAYFVAGQPVEQAQAVRLACHHGWGWADLDPTRWVPAVATCWPTRLVHRCVRWVDQQAWPAEFFADDEIIGRFIREAEERPLATVPSLIQHPDVAPSLVSDRARAGGDLDRVAACWIGGCHPSQIDWNLGPS